MLPFTYRFLRRLEKSIQKRDADFAVRSTSTDSCCHDGDEDDEEEEDGAEVIYISDGDQDSPGATSPLLVRTPVKTLPSTSATPLLKNVTSTGRQKRLANFYATNIPWRSRERRSIHGGEINSD